MQMLYEIQAGRERRCFSEIVFGGVLTLLLSVVLCATAPLVALAGGDDEAPEVQRATLENSVITEGDRVSVNLDVIEEGTGIVDVSVHFYTVAMFNEYSHEDAFLIQKQFLDGYYGYTGTISMEKYLVDGIAIGDYFMDEIIIKDYLGNTRTYTRSSLEENLVDASTGAVIEVAGQKLTILESDDDVAPKLLTIGVTPSIDPWGALEFNFEIEETGSGVVSIDLRLDNMSVSGVDRPSSHHELLDEFTDPGYKLLSGKYTSSLFSTNGSIGTSPHTGPQYNGEYWFAEITIRDAVGNSTCYRLDNPGSSSSVLKSSTGEEVVIANCLTVGDGAVDTQPPAVSSIEILSDKVARPGIATLRISISENETIDSLQINLEEKETGEVLILSRYLTDEGSPVLSSGTYDIEFPVYENDPVGNFAVTYCDITDSSGNRVCYSYWNYYNQAVESGEAVEDGILADSNGNRLACKGVLTVVEESLPVAFETRLDNPNLLSMIESMENSGIARINVSMWSSSDMVIPVDFFRVIAGTNKTLWFYGGGVEWIFNGLTVDANKAKDVYVYVSLSKVPGSLFGARHEIVRIDFQDNGELPGRAMIRIKADYVSYFSGITSDLRLYYVAEKGLYDQSVQFARVNNNGYIEFPILHNSTYLISDESIDSEVDASAILGKLDEVNDSNPGSNHGETCGNGDGEEALLAKTGDVAPVCTLMIAVIACFMTAAVAKRRIEGAR